MAAGTGIYITWVTGAIILSIAMMPLFKPKYAKLSLDGFIDMFRRYWAHMIVVFSVYLWKDLPMTGTWRTGCRCRCSGSTS